MSDTHSPRHRRLGRRPLAAIAAVALVAVGGGAGALAVAASRPSVTMAPATPVAIRSLGTNSGDVVTVRGNVAEIFGNKFVMADPTGHALIDLGREGEDGTLVATGQQVTVQGRFDHGSIHAAFLVNPDGKVTALGPVGGPHGHGPDDRDGPHGRGPDGPHGRPGDRPGGPDDRAAPPPPPPAGATAPTTTTAPATTPATTG